MKKKSWNSWVCFKLLSFETEPRAWLLPEVVDDSGLVFLFLLQQDVVEGCEGIGYVAGGCGE